MLPCRRKQGISGIGLQLFGLGLSTLLFKTTLGGVEYHFRFSPRLKIPLLGDIPYLGDVLFNHNILVYGAFLLVPLANWVLNRTTFGLKVRAVGQNPKAADTLGVNVTLIRYITVTLGGACWPVLQEHPCPIALINLFQENMTSGMGFIAVALVYFGSWRPIGVYVGRIAIQLRKCPAGCGSRCWAFLCLQISR